MRDVKGLDTFNFKLSPEETIIREKAFKCILEGIPVTPYYLHQITGMPHEQIKVTVDKLAQSGMIGVDSESGNVVGSHGLSLVETPHRLHINGIDLFTWCAIDAVGIPSALKMDAQIHSTCFTCQKKLTIELIKGQIVYSSKPNIQLWLVEADIGRSLVGCTWPQINFYCSVEHFKLWQDNNQNIQGHLLTLTDAAQLGKLLWRDVSDFTEEREVDLEDQ